VAESEAGTVSEQQPSLGTGGDRCVVGALRLDLLQRDVSRDDRAIVQEGARLVIEGIGAADDDFVNRGRTRAARRKHFENEQRGDAGHLVKCRTDQALRRRHLAHGDWGQAGEVEAMADRWRQVVGRARPDPCCVRRRSASAADRRSVGQIYDAPNLEAIQIAAERNGLPVDRITEIRVLDPFFYF